AGQPARPEPGRDRQPVPVERPAAGRLRPVARAADPLLSRRRRSPGAPRGGPRAPLRIDAVLLDQLVQVLPVHVGVARGLGDVAVGAPEQPGEVAALELLVPALLLV